jgi:dipeptidyl aminopeptidase/acylaminoacyl peptidase
VQNRIVLAAAVLCAAACKDSKRDAAPPAARPDGGAAAAPADAATAPGPRPPLDAGELAGLGGRIHAAAGKEGACRIVAIDPAKPGAPVALTPPGGSWFPVPGAAPLAVMTVDQGDVHLEQLGLIGETPDQTRLIGPRSAKIRSPSLAGDVVVFEADSASFRDLYRLDLRGDEVHRLTDDPEGNFEPALSPDGSRVAFTSSRDGDAEIYVMPLDGGAATRLTTFHRDDWAPQWSPDGAWIAFLSDREGGARVFVIRPDGTELRPLRTGELAGEEQGHVWSPDSTRVAYVVSTRDGASEIWVAELATGAARRVSAAGARDEAPTWSPQGRHLAYVSTRDRRIDLWVARADGSAESRLTDTPEEEWIPRWRP